MARTLKMLVEPAFLGTSAAAIYTCPTGTKTIVQRVTLCNVAGGAVTATLHIVPSGGSAGTSNTVVNAKSLASGESLDTTHVLHTLEPGDAIHALASAGTSITATVSGVEVT